MRPLLAPLAAAVVATVLLPPAAPASAAAHTDVAPREAATVALVSPRPGVVEAYSRTSAGTLSRQVRDDAGRWSTAQPLGGALTSAPAVVSSTVGRTDVFARGRDGGLLQRWSVDGRWGPWTALGGRITGTPSVISWAPGRLDVFARGVDGTLQHRWATNGRWSSWESLGGALASSPGAASTAPGAIDVAARGGDGQLLHKRYLGAGRWTGWTRLGGQLSSQPTLVPTGEGRLEVLWRGSDGALRTRARTLGALWSAEQRLPGATASGAGALLDRDGSLLVAARDAGGRPVTRNRPAGGDFSAWTALDGLRAFRGLGAWVDLYDYELPGASLSMTAALDDLDARGVRTVYLQTSRFSVGFDMASSAGRWVDAAHARGMSVVGWYLPGYGDLARDLRRTVAIAELVTPAGGRFDAVGVDIEAHTGIGSSNEVPRTTMNARAAEHLRQVRARTSAPLAAITPQPTATDGAGETWEGFPFAAVGAQSDLVLPMSYWPRTCRDACVRDYTATNARYAAQWSGKPVHIAGRGYPSGDGTTVSDSDIRAYVDGAVAAGALGGSVYDYASTRSRTAWWSSLARLNGLG